MLNLDNTLVSLALEFYLCVPIHIAYLYTFRVGTVCWHWNVQDDFIGFVIAVTTTLRITFCCECKSVFNRAVELIPRSIALM